MGVPDQVRKQTARIQELYADLNPEEQETALEEKVTEKAAPEKASANGEVTKPSSSEPADGEQDVEDPNSETYAQRFRTLQGKYNAEVPALNHQVRDLSRRLEQTQALLASMQQSQPTSQTVTQPTSKSLLTDQEREEYGESIDIMRKVSEEIVGPYRDEITRLNSVIQQMQGQVIPRVEHISEQQTRTSEQNFWNNLNNLVPNWREVNDNPDFQTWLLETDPLTGATRQTFLEDAQAKLDAHRVASFFNAWSSTPGHTAQSERVTKRTTELERQVAPGRGRTTSPPQGNQQKTYTTADISKFFDDVRRGAFKGRDDERARIERDIFAAQAEGRIQNA